MIPVTKPFLPPQQKYESLISTIWDNQWLTNEGPLVTELEQKLAGKLNVENLLFVANGTLALQMAIKALNLKGEIITTAFSFVATTSSIVWENCSPIFVDIDQHTLNIDANKIEASITEKTSAILATHVYGNPCDVKKIEEIAKKHNLKVIYDGAHAFGVEIFGKSVFEYGDISICSTHATKLYHTVEGGFMVSKNKNLFKSLKSMRNFGFKDKISFNCLGLNAKNSEFHAAMGLINLNYINDISTKRKEITERYDKNLLKVNVYKPSWNNNANLNYAYYPIIFETEKCLLDCIEELEANQIIARRYFYPSLVHSLPYVDDQELIVTDSIAKRILCLPLYFDLSHAHVDRICNLIIKKDSLFLDKEKSFNTNT